MTNLTILGPAVSFGDLLTTTNNTRGLSNVLKNVQDGFGNDSTIQIATNSVNFKRDGGNSFQLDGIPLTISATDLNNLSQTFESGTLTPANIMAMHGASIQLIPAPGPNLLIVVNKLLLSLVYNSISYENGDDVYLQYSLNGAAASSDFASKIITKNLILNGASAVGFCNGDINAGGIDFLPSLSAVNLPVCITNDSGAFQNGDSSIKYYVSYSVINLA